MPLLGYWRARRPCRPGPTHPKSKKVTRYFVGNFFIIRLIRYTLARFWQFSARQGLTSKDGGQAEMLRNEV